MKIRCFIELEHTGNFNEDEFADNLQDFIKNDEQTYYDKGKVIVTTGDCHCIREIGE